MNPRSEFPIIFEPLVFLTGQERAWLEGQLLEQRGPDGVVWVDTPVLRCREYWAISMPLGTFAGSYAALPSPEEERAACVNLVALAVRREPGAFKRSRDFIERGDRIYLRSPLVKVLRRYAPVPEMFVAAYTMLEAAVSDPEIIYRYRTDKPVVRPAKEYIRVPWTPEEDHVLRQWFSRRADGRRYVLTDEEWAIVLDRGLRGRRDRRAVLNRLATLNTALKFSLMRNGRIPVAKQEEYAMRMLGQREYLPRGCATYRERRAKAKAARALPVGYRPE
jgi:hypothetical protein